MFGILQHDSELSSLIQLYYAFIVNRCKCSTKDCAAWTEDMGHGRTHAASCLNDRFHLVTHVHWAQLEVHAESQETRLPSAPSDNGDQNIKAQCRNIPSCLCHFHFISWTLVQKPHKNCLCFCGLNTLNIGFRNKAT